MGQQSDSLLCLRAPQAYLGELADNWPELRARVHELVGTTIPEAWLESSEAHYEIGWKGVRLVRSPWQHNWLEPIALSLSHCAHRMHSLDDTRSTVEKAKESSPALKSALEESELPLVILHGVFARLLQERISISDTENILTTIVSHTRFTREVGGLVELVRTSLAPWISQRFERAPNSLDVVLLSEEVRQALSENARLLHEGLFLQIEPAIGRKVAESIERTFRHFGSMPTPINLLVDPHLRPIVSRLCERALPDLAILSWNEIHHGYKEEVHATVNFS